MRGVFDVADEGLDFDFAEVPHLLQLVQCLAGTMNDSLNKERVVMLRLLFLFLILLLLIVMRCLLEVIIIGCIIDSISRLLQVVIVLLVLLELLEIHCMLRGRSVNTVKVQSWVVAPKI